MGRKTCLPVYIHYLIVKDDGGTGVPLAFEASVRNEAILQLMNPDNK